MENNQRCPFLKIQACGYCSLFPLKKLIPVDQMKTASMCLSGDYQKCSQYEDVTKKELNMQPVNKPEVAEYNVKGFMIKKNYFYHYGHTWVKKESENAVRIGIDGFAGKLLSNLHKVELLSDTNILSSGKAFMEVQCGGKTGLLISPVDGDLLTTNESVRHDAGIVNREPYDNGWLVSASIKNDGLKWLLNDELAGKWMEIEAERLHSIVSQDIGITMTDGGIMIESLAAAIDEKEWKILIRAFLLNE